MSELKVTNISDLNMYGNGVVCQLPDFAEGQEFVAMVRRPSLMVLVQTGKIPNNLLATANRMFNGKVTDEEALKDPEEFKRISEVTITMAKAALAKPTYNELEEANIQLTDQQLLAIFNYSQVGVKALEPFRKNRANNEDTPNVEDVPEETVGDTLSE